MQGPDTADGLPELTDSGLRLDTSSITRTGDNLATEHGQPKTDTSMDTIVARGLADRPAVHPGDRLGEFRVEHELGAGGMGQVFAARRISGANAGELVALKYLERTSASLLYRFKQEFRALAGVAHENLVALGELVVLPDSVSFFTMELIDGVSFDDYVRGRTPEGQLPNLARLRRAVRQLVAGVRHLHQHGCIHRDLKPSNVLVTTEGRVVVLDFGLVQDHSEAQPDSPDDQIMGTPAYMSPEQAGLERAGPAADWYAVGVMLYECLSGRRPFQGNLTHLLFAKREYEPPEIDEFVADIPPDLAALCRRMLARMPEDRPSAREILAILDGRTDTGSGVGWGSLETDDDSMVRARAPFVGRTRELALLDSAFDRVKVGAGAGPAMVHLRGPSGYGKSALVREFLARVQDREQAVVLKGRCLERESVPYKGLDPVIDALSVHLRQIPRESLLALEPAHPVALARLFPVLDDLWRADRTRTSGLDAHELRERAFESLRELFTGVAKRRPLIVFIDDFHWANVDSARLLSSLLAPPDAPPMLVAVTYRDEIDSNEALQELTSATAVDDRDTQELFIGPLDPEETQELARALMGDDFDPVTAEFVASRAQGNPFFVGQLVQLTHGGSSDFATEELDQIVVRRILELDADSRRLLEVVAVAGGPVDRRVAFRASEIEDPMALLPRLREAELLLARSGEGGAPGTLETAHARIREVAVGELEPDALRSVHRRLADALEHFACDPEALAEHFERGGDRARAANYYERAAELAANSLAFLRAVALFRTTLELLPEDADPNRVADLRMGLAEQLINVGRGYEAAQLLLALADEADHPHNPVQVDPARARECRRLAADQLVKTGHVDEGLAQLDTLLRSVALQLPSGTVASVSALVWEQARARVRGFAFVRREASEVEPGLLDQIDTCFAVVNGLSTQETLLSALFNFRNLRLSLRAGEPYRVARALAYQCVIDVAGADWRRVEQHMGVARELAAELGDPQLEGFIDLCEASLHWFERRYPISGELHTKVIERLEGVPGAAWDRRTAQIHHMWTLVCQGRLREFWARAKGTTERARERGDMQEMVEVSSFMAVALVLAGKPAQARSVLTAALDHWKPGRYLFGDVWAFYGQVRILLHEGEHEQAIELATQTLAQMKRTFLSEHLLARYNVIELLCRCHLMAAVHEGGGPHVRRARRWAAKLRAAGNPTLHGHVAVIEAGLASLTGDAAGAQTAWAEAADQFQAQGMRGQLAAVRARQAQLLGDTGEGPAHAAHAAGYFELEDIEDPEGFIRLVAPARTLARE
ncbi:serine/threonine protein kinase [Enhygromyxa salina]|uniref:Serine/threonine protein kinase n=1 Tax=Enhygromyxa salina TaxID=215803 RepID=A0A0C1Z6W8_9BACT|nr:serine/threonine-protein kinase [Enhygromyxa salina]KIG13379.1 serine/threonine protein kinase [Enhygromyxa salina]